MVRYTINERSKKTVSWGSLIQQARDILINMHKLRELNCNAIMHHGQDRMYTVVEADVLIRQMVEDSVSNA